MTKVTSTVEKYRAYREADRELHHKLMDKALNLEVMMRVGKLLRIVRDKTFIFESTNEMNVVADRLIYTTATSRSKLEYR